MTSPPEDTAAEIMHRGCECIADTATVRKAAQMMQAKDVGALPVCGTDDRLIGMLTDRDIVVRCIAVGADPAATTAMDVCTKPVVWVHDSASARDVLSIMEERQLRRLPVIDQNKRLVGIITAKDIVDHVTHAQSGVLLEAVCRSQAM